VLTLYLHYNLNTKNANYTDITNRCIEFSCLTSNEKMAWIQSLKEAISSAINSRDLRRAQTNPKWAITDPTEEASAELESIYQLLKSHIAVKDRKSGSFGSFGSFAVFTYPIDQ
jgi:hypothetical protein